MAIPRKEVDAIEPGLLMTVLLLVILWITRQ